LSIFLCGDQEIADAKRAAALLSRGRQDMMRNLALMATSAAIWLLCVFGQYRPAVLGTDAPLTKFSAGRADKVLANLLGAERPHPVGSFEDKAVHVRVAEELQRLGVKVVTLSRMGCYGEVRWRAINCATVTDIIGEVSPGSGRAIVLMAHLDSVGAGPGAADDGANDAIILETIRAWKAQGSLTKHPILALFTDGEEVGMAGASAFLADPSWRQRVGVVVNLEARGNKGRSFLFQTSSGNGALINLYAEGVSYPATSSLYNEIYRALPNDTDLTPFLQAGIKGYNFAFVGDVAQYHNTRDQRRNLDLAAVQSQGESALGLLRMLTGVDFAKLQDRNQIFFDILGRWLPRMPEGASLPLSILAFFALGVAAKFKRERARFSLRQLSTVPLLLLGAVTMGVVLHATATLISRSADPSFAHPWSLRLALAFGTWSAAFLVTRLKAGADAVWLLFAGLGVLMAVLLPGFSPYFLFPSLLAAFLFLLAARAGDVAWHFATAIAAVAMALTWLNLAATGEAIMGLAAYPLLAASAGFALSGLIPLLRPRYAGRLALISIGFAFAFAIVAGLLPTYSYSSPQRLNLRYVEEGSHAYWVADPVSQLPQALVKVGNFTSIRPFSLFGRNYVAGGGAAENVGPRAVTTRVGQSIRIKLAGSSQASGMIVFFPKPIALEAINDQPVTGLPTTPSVACRTPDCAHASMTIEASDIGTIDVVETRYGLPPKGEKLLAARPRDVVPFGSGDQSLFVTHVSVH